MSLNTLAFFHALVAGFIGLGFVGALIQGFDGIGFSISLLLLPLLDCDCFLSFEFIWHLQLQQNYRFCIAVAACSAIIFPLGTILGLMTIRTLLRPEVNGSLSQPLVLLTKIADNKKVQRSARSAVLTCAQFYRSRSLNFPVMTVHGDLDG